MWGVLVFLYNKKNERAKLGREMNDVVAFGVLLGKGCVMHVI